MNSNQSIGEWRYGWPLVIVGLIGMTMNAVHFGPLVVLMKPLGELFGWSRSQISGGLTIALFVILTSVPFVGLLVPRFGVRNIGLTSLLIFAMGLVALGSCTSNVWSWYLGWVIVGMGLGGASPLVWTTPVTRFFVRQRGLALSVALSGTGIAAFMSPVISAYSLEHWGWRAPFFILAAIIIFVALPGLWWLMRTRPEFTERYSAGTPVNPNGRFDDKRPLREALKDIRYWQLLVAATMTAASVGMLMTHTQAIMRDSGLSVMQAASYFAITGPSLIIGRLCGGLILDRLTPRIAAALLFLPPAFAALILANYDGSAFWAILTCVLCGLGYGSDVDVLAYLTSRYFGTRDYPVLYSFVYSCFCLGYGLAALLGGGAFDHFGSYSIVLYGLVGAVTLAILLVLTLGPAKELKLAQAIT
ncbi:MFS transporter [Tardiphaga sp. 538_B7_N1_4]|uniref:MFS transporter n=1 Tax=Tardiphaga sp. 538_B7_N1_4 TaxID=3240778 RepID=UPI001B89F0E8|nr:MFS transporter [Bradyrhizobium diazoefficiens]MBR0967356.1 MFS transporter [Bradyrhizobium diazoefficiens]MBR0976677.1 MFS transporter [Bradyrhizobium diazoefficiens]MBR1005322.1 MFS transporter [Bradyrhizobium diazoefficiens]MBR1011795.1 MFS transporter [Bradyrhizobium diazoefficiens]MBR1049136.1 MFS transporter [Bradyrhizobium diazoefficiens]